MCTKSHVHALTSNSDSLITLMVTQYPTPDQPHESVHASNLRWKGWYVHIGPIVCSHQVRIHMFIVSIVGHRASEAWWRCTVFAGLRRCRSGSSVGFTTRFCRFAHTPSCGANGRGCNQWLLRNRHRSWAQFQRAPILLQWAHSALGRGILRYIWVLVPTSPSLSLALSCNKCVCTLMHYMSIACTRRDVVLLFVRKVNHRENDRDAIGVHRYFFTESCCVRRRWHSWTAFWHLFFHNYTWHTFGNTCICHTFGTHKWFRATRRLLVRRCQVWGQEVDDIIHFSNLTPLRLWGAQSNFQYMANRHISRCRNSCKAHDMCVPAAHKSFASLAPWLCDTFWKSCESIRRPNHRLLQTIVCPCFVSAHPLRRYAPLQLLAGFPWAATWRWAQWAQTW